MLKFFLYFTSVFFVVLTTNSCNVTNRFVFEDIHNFYEMKSELSNSLSKKDSIDIINKKFISKASKGLKEYIKYEQKSNNKNINNEYLSIIKSYSNYFNSQEYLLKNIQYDIKSYNKYFKEIKKIYPDAKNHKIYFSIGIFNVQGKMLPPNTIFISTEATINNELTNYSEFDNNFNWLTTEKINSNDLGFLVVHEYLHTLQKFKSEENSILNESILEGSAVFLTEYFCGENSLVGIAGISQEMLDFIKINEVQTWKEFTEDLNTNKNLSIWFWNENTKYPYSLGYYMGYMICKSYYENHADKNVAIRELIELKDPKLIYKQSKYFQKN